MDPVTRQNIWDILKQIRNEDRVIILTTHHLEEAEALADRVGIMSSGKLLALGSCDYITRTFGVGYHLVITSRDSGLEPNKQFILVRKDVIRQLVLRLIPSARLEQQTHEHVLEFLLPFEETAKFS